MKASLWSEFFHGLPVDDALAALAEAGFRYGELSCEMVLDPSTRLLSAAHAERVAAAAKQSGIGLGQVHYPICSIDPQALPKSIPNGRIADFASIDPRRREFELRSAEQLLELCPAMGIPVMVVHPGGAHSKGTKLDLHAENVAVFKRLAPVAETHGVTIAIENMGAWADQPRFGVEVAQLLAVIDEVGSAALGITYDSSHANFSGVDHAAMIRTAGAHLAATHLSDNLGQGDNHLMPYAGTVPWAEVAEALKAIDYRGLINLEIPGENRCPLDVRKEKAAYARRLLDIVFGQE